MEDIMLKKCKQCGEVKPLAEFRKYYHANGRYTKCKSCERINSREKYLSSKAKLNDKEQAELDTIHQIWVYQRNRGLTPPRTRGALKLDEMLADLKKPELPFDLRDTLYGELHQDPEFYYDLYDEYLLPKYRPVVGIDPETNLPKYDETYKDVLNQILKRIDDYEYEYYKED